MGLSIIILSFPGATYRFECTEAVSKVLPRLQALADSADLDTLRTQTDDETCAWFVNAAREQLGVYLHTVKVEEVIRIKKPVC